MDIVVATVPNVKDGVYVGVSKQSSDQPVTVSQYCGDWGLGTQWGVLRI